MNDLIKKRIATIIAWLLLFGFLLSPCYAESYYKNGLFVWHSDCGWPDANRTDYQPDNKFHILKCIDCPFIYMFHLYPKSSYFSQCPNYPYDYWRGDSDNRLKHTTGKMIEIYSCDTTEEVDKFMTETKEEGRDKILEIAVTAIKRGIE